MNKVNETIARIKDGIEYHNHEINVLKKAKEDIKIRIYGDSYKVVDECLDFKISFHEYRLKGLSEAHDEIIEEYNYV